MVGEQADAIKKMRVKFIEAAELTHGGSAQDAIFYKDGVPVENCAATDPASRARDAVHRVEVHHTVRGMAGHIPRQRQRSEGEGLDATQLPNPSDRLSAYA